MQHELEDVVSMFLSAAEQRDAAAQDQENNPFSTPEVGVVDAGDPEVQPAHPVEQG